MLEIGGDANLAQKTFDAQDGAELGIEHFERDMAFVANVSREVDRRHSSLTDHAEGFVTTRERCVQLMEIIHRACPVGTRRRRDAGFSAASVVRSRGGHGAVRAVAPKNEASRRRLQYDSSLAPSER